MNLTDRSNGGNVSAPQHTFPRATSARLLAAAGNILFGLRLLFPDDIFGSTPSYRYMERVFFGDVWLGAALLLFGIGIALAIRDDRWLPVGAWCISVAWLTWLLIAVLLAVANVRQIGTLAYLFIAATHAFAYAHTIQWRNQLARGVTR